MKCFLVLTHSRFIVIGRLSDSYQQICEVRNHAWSTPAFTTICGVTSMPVLVILGQKCTLAASRDALVSHV